MVARPQPPQGRPQPPVGAPPQSLVETEERAPVTKEGAIRQGEAEVALLAQQLDQLQITLSPGDREAEEEREEGVMTLEEYVEAIQSGEVKAYSGKKHSSGEARYADGWAFNSDTKRWINLNAETRVAARQNKNLAMATQRLQEQLEGAKMLAGLKEKLSSKTEMVKLLKNAAPMADYVVVVLDTNCFMDIGKPGVRQMIASGIKALQAIKHGVLLVPKEVLRELDGLKCSNVPQKGYDAREGIRLLSSLQQGHPGTMRGQMDSEIFRDDTFHRAPERLRGDDAIVNCCLYMEGKGAKVIVCSNDKVIKQRAEANRMSSCGLECIGDTISRIASLIDIL